MKKYNVGICDSDALYAVKFMEYINSKINTVIKVTAFTSTRALEDYIRINELDLVLSGYSPDCTSEGYLSGIRYVYLSEDRERGLFKYKSMEEIYRDIKDILFERSSSDKSVTECFCVYSPLGRVGKTEFAKALAANDEVRGGLYVGMEEYSGEGGGMVNAMYHIREKLSDLESIIEASLLREGNLYLLNSIGTYHDRMLLDKEDIQWFLNELSLSGKFSTIVFDIGAGALSDYRILELFDVIYIPVRKDRKSENKLKNFYNSLKDMNLRYILSKVTEVEVPDSEYRSMEMIRTVVKIADEREELKRNNDRRGSDRFEYV